VIITHTGQFRFYGFNKKYERHSIFNLEEILPLIGKSKSFRENIITVPGVGRLTLKSDRYLLFKREERNLVCVSCGLSGLYFALERHIRSVAQNQRRGEQFIRHRIEHIKNASWHFNLYGLLETGEERMLTKDHIMPKSKGGANEMWNYQLMCDWCNVQKSNKIPSGLGLEPYLDETGRLLPELQLIPVK
jgi:5-methylcytosine-specific restriction endonuclease McrA